MALPAGVTGVTVTFSAGAFAADGGVGSGSVIVSAPTNVLHIPSGEPIWSGDRKVKYVDGVASFTLCPTDQPGLSSYGWTYTVYRQINGARVQPEPFSFIVAAAGPSVIDGDALTPVPSSAGTPVSVTSVTSVAGRIGDVSGAQIAADPALRAAFVHVDGDGNLVLTVDGVDTIVGAGGGGGLTTEQIQDLMSTTLVAGANTTITYDDAAGTITVATTSSGGTVTSASITDATTVGRALLTATDAPAARTTLGLGTAATQPSSAFDAAGTAATGDALLIPLTQRGAANGVATLDGSSKIPQAQIPSVALTDYLGAVASQTAMLALIGQRGDWCTRTDLGTDWQLIAEPSTVLGSWRQMTYPASPVSSVAGRTGAVAIAAADVTDSTATGRSVLTAASAAAARTAIGAGTGNGDVVGTGITKIEKITQVAYDALGAGVVGTTLYVIVG